LSAYIEDHLPNERGKHCAGLAHAQFAEVLEFSSTSTNTRILNVYERQFLKIDLRKTCAPRKRG
jgi:hypothetical protein